MHTYTIAGLNVMLSGYTDEYTLNQMSPYKSNIDIADISINSSLSDCCFECEDPDNTFGNGNEYWCSVEGVVTAYLFPNDDNTFAVKIKIFNDGKNADVLLYDLAKHEGMDASHYLFNTLAFMFRYAVLYHNRLVFHSSSLAYGGFGVAFSADSGVGKSTHTGLWMEHIPGCEYINDDTPLLYLKGDTVHISGTPFAGSTGINTNVDVPLKAIVFLERGADNVIEKMDTQEAFVRFMGQVAEPFDTVLMNSMIDVISDVLARVPVYRLYCNISSEAAYTACERIFGAGN